MRIVTLRGAEGAMVDGTGTMHEQLIEETQRRLRRSALLANGLGAFDVFVFAAFLLPLSTDSLDEELLLLLNGIVLAVGFPLTFRIAADYAHERLRAATEWACAGRPPTADERQAALRMPLFQVRVSIATWSVALLLFGTLNTIASPTLGLVIAATVALGGVTTGAVNYLLAERILRPVTALALAGSPPERAVGPGVRTRLTMAWALGTGMPLLGLSAVAAVGLLVDGLDLRLIIGAALFLAMVALAVGLLATRTVAGSLAEPLDALRGALARVERGDLGATVTVDDGSEVGHLQAGLNRMVAGLRERERLQDLFGRHVGEEVARAAVEGTVRLGGEVRDVGVLFVDLVGSTTLAARRPPTEVVAVLNTFFEVVVEAVARHGGWVNKFEGDAALCVFGAPAPREDPAGDALAAARDLLACMGERLPELDAGIGVSAGPAVAGNVGAEERFEYTVIGDPVNEAARLCELAKQRVPRLAASDAAVARARDAEAAHWALGEAVVLRGRDVATRVATATAR